MALINFSKKLGGNSQSFLFSGHFIDVGMQTFSSGVSWADDVVRSPFVFKSCF